MATEKPRVLREKGFLIFGVILLAIGIGVSFIHVTTVIGSGEFAHAVDKGYPYQGIGLALVVAGIIFGALAFVYPLPRTPTPQEP
ncbi:MAG TPA: hypothetical protein VMS94_01205 [Acidobacteriota bacterium]|nr:hypothetical protein [Acidobacteriota bacterium]